MNKMTKWWKRFSFWDKVRMILASLGAGGELTLFLVDSYPEWKLVAGGATFVTIILTYGFRDENKNGIVDLFEKKINKK